MSTRRVVAIAAIISLAGCANVTVNAKLPSSATAKAATTLQAPEAGAKPVANAEKPVADKTAAPTVPTTVLEIPSDVGIRLPGSLLDETAAGVISNDGSTLVSEGGTGVISNDGSSVISNDGSSLVSKAKRQLLAAADAQFSTQQNVADFFHHMVDLYGVSVRGANVLLAIANDPDNLAQLTAGQRLDLDLPGLHYGMVLKTGAQGAVLHVYSGTGTDHQLLRMSFTDKDHGQALFVATPDTAPGTQDPYYFSTTFDRSKNVASIDVYYDGTGRNGQTRLHMAIERPEQATDGHTLVCRVAAAARGSSAGPNGLTEATAYGLPDGSATAIFGSRTFDATGDVTFLVNPLAAAGAAHPEAFYIDAKGRAIATPTQALAGVLPPQTDIVKPYFTDPATAHFDQDAVFKFPD